DLAQAGFLFLSEPRAGAHEVDVVALDQTNRLRIEAERIASGMEPIDAREELRVQQDRVLVRGELRRELGLDRLTALVRVGGSEREEGRRGALEQLSGSLERDDGVLEGRRLGILRDRLDLLEMLGHAALERGREVLVLDQIERR